MTRIEAAAAAMITFLQELMGPQDRCTVSAFNDGYHELSTLGNEEKSKRVLAALTRLCQKDTHLWDAVCLSVRQFIQSADRTRPWVLIVLTDGKDSGSKTTVSEAATLLQVFTRESSNFAFVVGVGHEVDETGMKQLCQEGGAFYLPAKDLGVLMTMFALIALQVRRGVQLNMATIQAQGQRLSEPHTAVYAELRQTTQVSQRNTDILLCVDVSGSMLML